MEAPQNLSKKRGIVAPVARPALGRIRRRKIRPRLKSVAAAGSQKPVQQEQQVGLKIRLSAQNFRNIACKNIRYLEKNCVEFSKNWVLFRTVAKMCVKTIICEFSIFFKQFNC
jgi:hypothetical protein